MLPCSTVGSVQDAALWGRGRARFFTFGVRANLRCKAARGPRVPLAVPQMEQLPTHGLVQGCGNLGMLL